MHRPTIVLVTACTKNRRPILANEIAHQAIICAWTNAASWRVGRYVVMPDHVHLFAAPRWEDGVAGATPSTLGNWVAFWKSQLARTMGSGVWQEGYWDRTLRSGENYADKWEYVRKNPVRKGLAADANDWPFAGELNELRW